jgi:rod shape-determining protein MreC
MHNLLKFIHRYHFFFLFLILETAAFTLTILNQQYQQSFFLHSANKLTAGFYNTVGSVKSYLYLKEQNRQLMEEYADLLGEKDESFLKRDTLVFESGDAMQQARYSYIQAEVINNSVIRRNNYITLNKGRLHGVAPDMGVITPDGVAGIIVNVSENFSVAMSFLHNDMLVSTVIKKNNHLGTLSWEGVDYRKAIMTYIPPHVELSAGDSIVTSGYSTVFPENIFIGTIQDWDIRRGENFYTAEIDLALDFNRLSYVYVIRNLMKEEQEELEHSVTEDY